VDSTPRALSKIYLQLEGQAARGYWVQEGGWAVPSVRYTIAFTAAHGATDKRLCECGNLFGRAKKRVRSYFAAVDAMQQKEAGSELHATKAGDSDEISCRQAGAAAVVEGAPGAPPGSVEIPVAP